MTALVVVLALAAIALSFLWLRSRSRAVVDGCVIRMWQDTHCTAIVEYRQGKRIVRFGGEIGVPRNGGTFLRVDMPLTMFTERGEVIGADEYDTVKDRLSRGLSRLGIRHELVAPKSEKD